MFNVLFWMANNFILYLLVYYVFVCTMFIYIHIYGMEYLNVGHQRFCTSTDIDNVITEMRE